MRLRLGSKATTHHGAMVICAHSAAFALCTARFAQLACRRRSSLLARLHARSSLQAWLVSESRLFVHGRLCVCVCVSSQCAAGAIPMPPGGWCQHCPMRGRLGWGERACDQRRIAQYMCWQCNFLAAPRLAWCVLLVVFQSARPHARLCCVIKWCR